MDKILEYSISYPFLEHPLANEKEQVKLKYTALLRSFADQFGDNKDINAMRAERYISDFLNDGQPNTGELKSAINEIRLVDHPGSLADEWTEWADILFR